MSVCCSTFVDRRLRREGKKREERKACVFSAILILPSLNLPAVYSYAFSLNSAYVVATVEPNSVTGSSRSDESGGGGRKRVPSAGRQRLLLYVYSGVPSMCSCLTIHSHISPSYTFIHSSLVCCCNNYSVKERRNRRTEGLKKEKTSVFLLFYSCLGEGGGAEGGGRMEGGWWQAWKLSRDRNMASGWLSPARHGSSPGRRRTFSLSQGQLHAALHWEDTTGLPRQWRRIISCLSLPWEEEKEG